MSLQTRIVALVSAVLMVSIALCAIFTGVQARRSLHAELQAGLTGGGQTLRSALESLPRSTHPQRDLIQLVRTFDGNRHVAASLVKAHGRIEAASRSPGQPGAAPGWFEALVAPRPEQTTFPTPTGAAIVLSTVANADLEAIWNQLSGVVGVLCGSALVGLGLVFLVVRAALSPLRELSAGFAEIGRGDYGGRVRERGPREIVRLEKSFNEMAGRLDAMRERNVGLERQLLTLQDEERAELARDLHDDIGPHLFAVSLDAQMIAQLLAAGRPEGVPDQVEAIQATVGHVQREVRAMLARLRPARVTELGLDRAIADIVKFWGARRPEIAFHVRALDGEAGLSDALKDTAFRVAQEAVNNAVRHSRPSQIDIALSRPKDALFVEVRNDGVPAATPRPGGFGLIGMNERVASLGGVLTVEPAAGERGTWSVSARLPAIASFPERPVETAKVGGAW